MGIKRTRPSPKEAGEILYIGSKGYIAAYCALTTVVVGQPVIIIGDTSSTNHPRAIAPTLQTALNQDPMRMIAVALDDITVAGWYWFQFAGEAEALCYSIAGANDTIKVANGGTYFISDSATAVESQFTVGISIDAQATAASVITTVWLYGRPVKIDRFNSASIALAGDIKKVYSSTYITEYICAYTALTTPIVGTPLILEADYGTTLYNPKATESAKLGVPTRVVVAQEIITAAGWYWFAIRGVAQCLIEGTTDVGIGDSLKLANVAPTYAVQDSATEVTSASFAIAREAQAANSQVEKTVYLIGDPVIINA